MKIKTCLLSEFPKEQAIIYLKQIAKWHFMEWGKYLPNSSEKDWEEKLIEGYGDPNIIRIIALDENNTLVGSISLKLEYMKEDFPDFFPWLSGLFVCKSSCGRGISGLLINSLVKIALAKKFKNIYVFTHDLSLEQFYIKFGWSLIKPSQGEQYRYRDSPILLLKSRY